MLRLLSLLLVLLACLVPRPALAHWSHTATAEVHVEGPRLEMLLTIPTKLLGPSDSNRDGKLSLEEIRADTAGLAQVLGGAIRPTSGGQEAFLQVEPWEGPPPEGDLHTRLRLVWVFPAGIRDLALHYDLFPQDEPDSRCLATVSMDGDMRSFVFTPEQTETRFGAPTPWAEAWTFLKMGVEHLLTGYDHILFLMALLLAGGSIRYLVGTITAFTLAHSLTLSLAVLDLVKVTPEVVEPLIAASIVYAALENFWRRKLDDRWVIAFLFGLVHGIGFAGILREAALSGGNLLIPLASFNVGVELGQLLVVVPAFFLFRPIFADEARGRRFTRITSAVVALLGLYWFLERVGVL